MTALTENNHQNCEKFLQELIRIDTTNPPGNELPAALYLKKIFDDHGIACKIFEPKPKRASIIARLSGNGQNQPFLMSSHLDVVPAENQHWAVAPFSGSIHNDCIWGRGAVDMKNMTAMALSVFLKLKTDNIPLKRDVIFAAVADEEAGSHNGAKWLVDHHPEWLQAEYGVNEVGGFNLEFGQKTFYPIGVAEKGVVWLNITAQGEAGHGSLPNPKNALQKIGKLLVTLNSKALPFQSCEIVSKFVLGLAEALPFPKNLFLQGLTSPSLHCWLAALQKNAPLWQKLKPLFYNTATPTGAFAGSAINVIPDVAKITVDGRILPGSSVAEFLQTLQKIIGNDFSLEVLHAQEPSVIKDYDNDFFKQLSSTLKTLDPGSIPLPFVIPGFTDSHHYHRLGIKCYGFAPAKLPSGMSLADLYHAHNERLPLSALRFGLEALWDVAHKWCVNQDSRKN